MRLDEILERWKKPWRDSKQAERRWDAMAPTFYGQEVPAFEKNELLRLIDGAGMIGPESRVLEIGCGTGKYCLALAGRSASVMGLDISEKMLEHARDEASRLGLENIEFTQADWRSEDTQARGWTGAFDLVLAWITPAVVDYESFRKFSSASRGWCVLGNHVFRAESLSDRFRLLFGIEPAKTAEDDLVFATAALLREGKRPYLDYAENSWERTSSYDELYAKYRRRLETYRPLSPELDDKLRAWLAGEVDAEGLVHERLSATIGIIYWRN